MILAVHPHWPENLYVTLIISKFLNTFIWNIQPQKHEYLSIKNNKDNKTQEKEYIYIYFSKEKVINVFCFNFKMVDVPVLHDSSPNRSRLTNQKYVILI